jgi:medium-chain acyl-[acyl-carrier-protein] hydrolase
MTDLTMNRWLYRRELRASPRVRLFCFPYAGVGPSAYRLWHGALPAEVDVCVIQLPGREGRFHEPAFTNMAALISALTPALLPHLDVPFVFFGHSMGSVVACEVARSLTAAGSPRPAHVIVSGRRALQETDPDSPLSHLSDEQFVAEIDRRYGGIPAAILADREMLALLLPCLRADIAALESYVPTARPQLNCPLTVLGGNEDTRAPVGGLHAWQEQTSGSVRVRTFPGDHFYLNARRAEVLAEVAAVVTPLLRRQEEPLALSEALP